MAKITFITKDGKTSVLEGKSGSVMELAVNNNIKGIDGDCGGVCSCATCHVHVAEVDLEKTGSAYDIEKDMLELDDNANQFSRLTCQIQITEVLDGITFYVAND